MGEWRPTVGVVDADAEGPSSEDVEWANALVDVPLGEAAAVELIGLVREGSGGRAQMAAWALGFGKVPAHLDERALEALLEMLADTSRPGAVRGHAAEAVGNRLDSAGLHDPARGLAELRLTDMLSDPSPEVRFWSAFGLGKLRADGAVAALRPLTVDDTLVIGWWTVGEEAADAIDVIEGREPRVRTPEGR